MFCIFLINLPIYYFFGSVSPHFVSIEYVLILLLIVAIAFLYNLLYFFSLSGEEICDVEPFSLFHYPFAMLMAFIVFPAERDFTVFLLMIVASLALTFSRIEKRHININKYFFAMLGFTFLISLEGILAKVLLEVMSPAALYTFRTGFLSLLFFLFLKSDIKNIEPKKFILIFINGGLTVMTYIFFYYSIFTLGIVKTSLIMILAPVIVLFLSKYLLKENLTFKKAIADIVIVFCAIIAVFRG